MVAAAQKYELMKQMDKTRSKFETWLRCKKCKLLTRHTISSSGNPKQLYKCQQCGEIRKL